MKFAFNLQEKTQINIYIYFFKKGPLKWVVLEYGRGHGILRYTHRKGRADEADDETAWDESPRGSTTAHDFPVRLVTSSSVLHRWILQKITNQIQISAV